MLGLFDITADGKAKLSVNPSNRFLSEQEVCFLYQHVFKMSKNATASSEIGRLGENRVFIRDLVNKRAFAKITEYEMIKFSLKGHSMLLTDVFFSKVFSDSKGSKCIKRVFEITIERECQPNLLSIKIELQNDENRVKLENPIQIDTCHTYAIVMKTDTMWKECYTYKSTMNDYATLAPNVTLSFKGKNSCSLISHLCFVSVDLN